MDEMIWDIWAYEQWHMPPALPGDGLRMPGLDRAQAKKDSADANVATSPRTLCSLGKARWNKGFKFGPILPSVAIVQLAEAGTNCPWCGCTLTGSAITFREKEKHHDMENSRQIAATTVQGTESKVLHNNYLQWYFIPKVRGHRYL